MFPLIPRIIRYAWHRVLHPDRADFISMGLGIEARSRRCRRYWAKHLELSREFQERTLRDLPAQGTLAIFGAGRLLDVSEEVLRRFSEVHLFDADAGCVGTWKRLARRLAPQTRIVERLGDLTGTLDRWSKALEHQLEQRAIDSTELARFLSALELGQFQLDRSFDAAVSLNLLSQIPIYWRDRFDKALRTRELAGDDSSRTVTYALEDTMRRLQLQHLGLLAQTGAGRVVVISDRTFFSYEQSQAEWSEEPALYIEQPITIRGFEPSRSESWLWHIAPQGIEDANQGWIHEVEAIEFISALQPGVLDQAQPAQLSAPQGQ